VAGTLVYALCEGLCASLWLALWVLAQSVRATHALSLQGPNGTYHNDAHPIQEDARARLEQAHPTNARPSPPGHRALARAGRSLKRQRVGQAALAGVGIYLAYVLVLLAMAGSRNVSHVVAFRQLGIVWGTLLGIVVLREPRSGPKLVGVGLLVVGLVLVGIG
jgi:multidrug transporter EmrE-like cation transporter